MNESLPHELRILAHAIVETPGANIGVGASIGYAQLIASALYEVLRRELKSPTGNSARKRVLIAALERCQQAAAANNAALALAELKATLATLEAATQLRLVSNEGAAVPDRAPPRFKVIEGGLSKLA